ncbi:MAG: hypothetical protein K8I03_12870 [Ignavibacteria bacterium]|nr:hypothetical protein [Ignavibacteria bacterium]
MRIKKNKTISKGYRLKPETHKLITKIQRSLKISTDEVLNKACSKYFEELNPDNGKSIKKLTIV